MAQEQVLSSYTSRGILTINEARAVLGRDPLAAAGRQMPFFSYCRWSCGTSHHDAAVTKHGDGFVLTTIDPQGPSETRDLVIRSAAVADGLVILVGGDTSVMADSFAIGWSGVKDTFESEASSQDG